MARKRRGSRGTGQRNGAVPGWLDEDASKIFLKDLPKLGIRDLRSMMTDAGLRYRTEGGRTTFRLDDDRGPMFYAKALTTQRRQYRSDCEKVLNQGSVSSDLPAFHEIREARRNGHLDVTQLNELQYALYVGSDFKKTLEPFLHQGSVMWRIGSNPVLFGRQLVWEIWERITRGEPVDELPIGERASLGVLTGGMWHVAPAGVICLPLLARYQPLCFVLTTHRGAEVAVLAPGEKTTAGQFGRPQQFVDWPTGMSTGTMSGPGVGAYSGIKARTFSNSDVSELLLASVERAGQLFDWLTDPSAWTDDEGKIDFTERGIVVASITQGISAMLAVAKDWRSASSFWSALRALGTLQGIWEGSRQGGVHLRELFNPAHLRDHAVRSIPNARYAAWAEGLVDSWQRELLTIGENDLDEGLKRVEQLRHLVHGVGGQGRHARDIRLQTLKLVERHAPSLQLLLDVAALWWSAVIWDHSAILRPGSAPWEAG
jgi:hypothetical protein